MKFAARRSRISDHIRASTLGISLSSNEPTLEQDQVHELPSYWEARWSSILSAKTSAIAFSKQLLFSV